MKTVVFRPFSEGQIDESLRSPELAFTRTSGNLAIISRHQSIDSQTLRIRRVPTAGIAGKAPDGLREASEAWVRALGHSSIGQHLHGPPGGLATADAEALSTPFDPFDEMVLDEWPILNVFVWSNGSTYRQSAVWFRDGINCRNIPFAIGNHDESKVLAKLGLFQSMFQLADIEVAGQPLTLCHYPMRAWNKAYHGAWQLYGHVHGRNWKSDLKGSSLTLDVGVDTPHGYKPWTFEEVQTHMQRIYPRYAASREKHI